MEEESFIYYKKNVPYSVIVRRFRGDFDGILLDGSREVIDIKIKDLKNFKDANKYAILQGLIKEVAEPVTNWETANALTDEDISDLLKNYLKLKNALNTIDSLPILYKIREAATEKGLSKKSISLIASRIDELEPDDTDLNAAINARKEVN